MSEINTEQLKKEIKEELIKSEILMSFEDSEGLSFKSIISFFKRRWMLIISIPIVVGILSIIYSLNIPNSYKSTASVYVYSTGKSSALNGFLNSFNSDSHEESGNVSLLNISLKSEAMSEFIINRFGLATNPAIIGNKTPSDEDLIFDNVLKKYDSIVNINYDTANNLIRISAETMDPSVSCKIVEACLSKLDEFTKGPNKQKLDFIKNQLDIARKELEQSENELKGFQEKNNVILIQNKSNRALDKLTALEKDKNEVDISLEQLNILIETNQNSKIDITELKAQFEAEKAKSSAIEAKIKDLKQEIESLPEIMLEFDRLKRAVLVKEKIYSVLNEQHEIAKISEAEEGYQYKIVDKPRIAKIKSKPSRIKICITAVLISLILSILLSLLLDFTQCDNPRQ